MQTTLAHPPRERLHGLDAVRGIALLLGLVVHASMSWIPGAQHFWVVSDASPGEFAGLLFYVPHMFRMLLFFLVAGLFARMACERLGTLAFIRDRARRIAIPLASLWFPMLMTIVAVIAWNAWLVNNGSMPPAPPTPPLSPRNFPLTHLWFLYVLLLCYIAALALRATLGRSAFVQRAGDACVPLLASPAGPLLLALPLAAALITHPKWFAWFGIPTPEQSLYPSLAACVAFGSAFAFGWLLHRQQALLQRWASHWPLHLAIAVSATVGCVLHVGLAPKLVPATQDIATVGYAIAYALAGWSWTFAILGLGLRFLSGHSPVRRYLADASYWIYIAHLPLVMAMQLAMSRVDWPWIVEFPIVLAVAMSLLLLSYDVLVRNTWIGGWLNGRRKPRGLEAAR
ncbi:acyltransferase family protein [Thermomonas sp.]|uniref:acyltransferase family protein n=1 Tax=Thermomonas sp. TaxID=1971895 RepID=UPI0035B0EDCE